MSSFRPARAARWRANTLSAAQPAARGLLGAGALCALGAVTVGLSPIFVRVSDTAPEASAFWRALLALPVLALWALWERRRRSVDLQAPPRARARRWIWLAGAFFAGDLFFWHLAIAHTSLANASFLTNCLPVVFVAAGAWALLSERPSRAYAAAVVVALTGAALLGVESVRIDPAHLFGDLCAAATAVFFSAYVIALKRAPGPRLPGLTALEATAATTACLGAACLVLATARPEFEFWPTTAAGWAPLLGLGVLCQGLGQGAIIAALSRVPAGLAAMIILLEPVTTVVLGWLWLGEALSPLQTTGGLLALAAILVAARR